MMIYIVSGYMRTGTSMMMRALEAGGLEAVRNPDRERMNRRFGDALYQPNGGGFYELSREQYLQVGFPRMYEGKLIKVLVQGLPRLVVHEYRVIFMLRHPEEIRQSYEAFFGGVPAVVQRVVDHYDELMEDAVEMLENRKDTEVGTFLYRQVVRDPLSAFRRLAACGWPIDAERAAGVVDPELCRFRLEELEVGI